MDIEIASPCALIVNELVTNCLKHAFPGRRAGRIVVTLVTGPRDDELLLQVADDGVGKVSAAAYEEPSTFGFLLVAKLVDQMGARLSVRSEASGTTVALSFFPCGAIRVAAKGWGVVCSGRDYLRRSRRSHDPR